VSRSEGFKTLFSIRMGNYKWDYMALADHKVNVGEPRGIRSGY